ncbi:DNA polymerase III subunit gamma/tau [Alteromonas sp. ASW11-19]|uniref:DNA-directed DNA polymerase n=1 Tax=Alteromonas salexigens TaxID=2982530 RepID=A0ABT2VRS0_9ALTE|nr:DNA polymerase III subunit gamma/tau [Alteromonas salexigens]MCU7556006.1 DNA polymerase III subunit gamma/tau [Alteromonas salexigens]
MSYQVLARKWRPGKFSELVGQEHVVSAISNALDNDRLHHAYLFTGTRGVGKTTIARIFSKSLNCEEGQGANPCGQCHTCREIEQGNYVDLLEIDAASRTKVEDTRELLDNVQYKPTRGRYKVYLIDEVHMLSKHSFNALLKTLEEPPPHVKFLLATTDPQKLPITILSRCLQFNLKALSREQITGQLEHILQAESVAFEAPALNLLARAAQGSMRDALSLTDQAIAQGDNHVLAAIVTDMLGLMDKHQLLRLIHAVVKKAPDEALAVVDSMAEQAPDYSQVLAELSSILHQIALTQWVPDACKLETTAAKAIYQLARSLPAEQVQLLYQIALQGQKELPYAPDGRSGLEMTVLRMMSFSPTPDIEGVDELLSSGPEAPQSTPVNTAPVPASNYAPSVEQLRVEPATESADLSANAAVSAPGNADVADAASHNAPADSEMNSDTATVTGSGQSHADAHSQPEAESEEDNRELTAEMQGIEAQAHSLRPAPESAPAPSAEAAVDTGPASDEQPPLSAYEDMPPEQGYDDMDYPAPAETQAPDTDLTTTQDMLALRQRLKKAREESRQSGVKKSEEPAERSLTDLGARMRRPAPSDSIGQPAPSAAPEQVTDAQADAPPWETRQPTPQPDTLADEPVKQESEPETQIRESAQTSGHAPEHAAGAASEAPAAYQGAQLSAYLDDNTKLTHASQIDRWSQLVEAMPVAGLLKQVALHSAYSENDEQVTLELDENQAHLLNNGTVEQLTEAMCEALGRKVTLQIQLGNPQRTPFQIQQSIQAMRQQHAEQVVNSDTTIQQLLNTFQASIVAESVKAR